MTAKQAALPLASKAIPDASMPQPRDAPLAVREHDDDREKDDGATGDYTQEREFAYRVEQSSARKRTRMLLKEEFPNGAVAEQALLMSLFAIV